MATFIAASEDVNGRGVGGKGNWSSGGRVLSESSEDGHGGGDGVSSDLTKDEKVCVDRAFHALRSF